jgi:predicted permease
MRPILHEWWSRLRETFRPRRNDADLEDELRHHLEMAADAAGVGRHTPDAARDAALRSGFVPPAMDALRDQRGFSWLRDAGRDVRYGARLLMKYRSATAMAIASLALGIGANTAIFTIVNAIALRPLPVRAPGDLVELLSHYPGEPRMNGFAWKYFESYRERNHVFADLVGMSPWHLPVGGPGFEAEPVDGAYVSGGFFAGLGPAMAVGRAIDGPSEGVVSWAYWRRRFNLDPAVVGQSITVNGAPVVIVGVTAKGFTGLQLGVSTDVWLPASMEPVIQQPSRLRTRDLMVGLIGRLRPGVTMEQARAEMATLDRPRVEAIAGASQNPAWREAKLELASASAGFSRGRDVLTAPLLILLTVVTGLLLLACLNIATMLVARAESRRAEMALRVSLGAGRHRLVRQILAESLLLSVLGASLGLLVAYFGIGVVMRMLTSLIAMGPVPLEIPLQPDGRVLVFTTLVCLTTTTVFGFVPAWDAWSLATGDPHRRRDGVDERRAPRRVGHGLVILQVALSVVLLTAAASFARYLSDLRNVGLGFDRHNVVLVTVNPPGGPDNRALRSANYRQLIDRLEAIPGVTAASFSAVTPLSGAGASRMMQAQGFEEAPDARRYASLNFIAPHYFRAFGTPLLAGRDFDFDDVARPPVVIINEAASARYFPGASPLGKHVMIEGAATPFEIVGVVANAKYANVHSAAPQTAYLNAMQHQGGPLGPQWAIRRTGSAAVSDATIRRVIEEELSTSRIGPLTSLTAHIDAKLGPERMIALTSGVFGALGAALAAAGLFGLLAYSVARRTKEIGVRMALGASVGDMLRMVMTHAAALVAAGLAIGVPVAYWSQRVAERIVGEAVPRFGVSAIVIGVLAIAAVTITAAYIPARRAAHVEPMVALRE